MLGLSLHARDIVNLDIAVLTDGKRCLYTGHYKLRHLSAEEGKAYSTQDSADQDNSALTEGKNCPYVKHCKPGQLSTNGR